MTQARPAWTGKLSWPDLKDARIIFAPSTLLPAKFHVSDEGAESGARHCRRRPREHSRNVSLGGDYPPSYGH